jgi:hypothetical protein
MPTVSTGVVRDRGARARACASGPPSCRWFTYYAHRIADDVHWGKNLSGLKFNVDSGFYIEAMRDLKFVAGSAAMQFMRGPMFSGTIKSEVTDRGHYDVTQLDETQLRERFFFGGGIPSVRALNGRPKPEDVITRGGMHGPCARMVGALSDAFSAALDKKVGRPLPRLAVPELKRKLGARMCPFDHAKARRLMHGGQPAALAMPKAPTGGWMDENRPWWVQPPAPRDEPCPEVATGAEASGGVP